MDYQHPEFDRLLKGYLSKSLSGREIRSFYQLVQSGEFDDYISSEIFDELKRSSLDELTETHRLQLERIYNERIENSTNEESENVTPYTPWRGFARKWAIAASLIGVAVLFSFFVLNFVNRDSDILTEWLPGSTGDNNMTKFVDRQALRLPDGSTVILNDGAELIYDEKTYDSSREVQLKGEAFFDIKPSADKQFIVLSGPVKTTVLGTAFNVKALPSSKEVEITVSRGKVSVGNATRTFDLVTADQQLTVNTQTNEFRKIDIKPASAIAWKEEFLIFDDVTLETAAEELYKRFGVAVHFKNQQLKKCHVTASFLNNENLEHVLLVISTIHGFSYSLSNNASVVTLDGEGRCD